MSQFETLIQDAKAFYAELDANNTREWWQDHKATYDTMLKVPALALLAQLTSPLGELTGVAVKTKLFRPYRDVRFSKDKTPYNTHLHMAWPMDSGAPQSPVFFFGIGINYVTVGAGVMGFDKPVLLNWRTMVDLDTDRITGIVADVAAKGFTFREPALKRVPTPFDKDHKAGHLLRMKGVVASKELDGTGPLPDRIMTAYETLWPLNNLLISVAEA